MSFPLDTDGLELSWGIGDRDPRQLNLLSSWAHPVTPEWAWGDSQGAGVRVCVLDSGVEVDHPMVEPLDAAYSVRAAGGDLDIVKDDEGDVCGHGTACAGVLRTMAPACSIISVRVLKLGFFGSGEALITGLRWAIESDAQIINMSLSTTRPQIADILYRLADVAYFRNKLIIASAHNTPVPSYPWRFASVVSVASHREANPDLILYNPAPPAEFLARGEKVRVAWLNGGNMICSGNSFATPHVAARCARILSAHPELTPFQVKTILQLTAANVMETQPWNGTR